MTDTITTIDAAWCIANGIELPRNFVRRLFPRSMPWTDALVRTDGLWQRMQPHERMWFFNQCASFKEKQRHHYRLLARADSDGCSVPKLWNKEWYYRAAEWHRRLADAIEIVQPEQPQ